jgi:hypothetical protein
MFCDEALNSGKPFETAKKHLLVLESQRKNHLNGWPQGHRREDHRVVFPA